MLGEFAVFETYDVGGDPCRGTAVTGKTSVGDNVVAFGEDHVIFVTECPRKCANKTEQAIAAGGM